MCMWKTVMLPVPQGKVEGKNSSSNTVKSQEQAFVENVELFGLPLLVQSESGKTLQYLWRVLVQQCSRFIAVDSEGKGGILSATEVALAAACFPSSSLQSAAAEGSESRITDTELLAKLPFTVRIIHALDPVARHGNTDLLPDPHRTVASIISLAAVDDVASQVAVELVVSVTTKQDVVAGAAKQRVVAVQAVPLRNLQQAGRPEGTLCVNV